MRERTLLDGGFMGVDILFVSEGNGHGEITMKWRPAAYSEAEFKEAAKDPATALEKVAKGIRRYGHSVEHLAPLCAALAANCATRAS